MTWETYSAILPGILAEQMVAMMIKKWRDSSREGMSWKTVKLFEPGLQCFSRFFQDKP
jgi:hypothetical protein